MVSRPVVKAPDIAPLESLNWLIHHSFTHAQFIQCKELISGALRLSGMPLEYPLYCSGMIYMRESNALDALTQFQACAQLNPTSANYKKQCARCLLILGRHDEALRYYADTAKITPNDWEVYADQGLCHQFKGDNIMAEEYFLEACKHTKEGLPFEALAKLRTARGDIDGAIEVLKDTLSYRNDQPDLLTQFGMLYLKRDAESQAFEQIGTALSYRPNHFEATLIAASVMQAHGDYDVAASKYRAVLRDAPEDAVLWNNIGAAYFGKKKLLSSLVCLRRAAYLNPLNWVITANRGVVALHIGQYASAVQMFRASIQLFRQSDEITKRKAKQSRGSYSEGMLQGLLALAYIGLDDHERARAANLLACKKDRVNPVLPLNFSAALYPVNPEESLKALHECQQRLIKYGSLQMGFETSQVIELIKALSRNLIDETDSNEKEQLQNMGGAYNSESAESGSS
ncbi:Bardet-Biedl syndrome 4 protein [Fasciola hepatica]|uniref:Bardet-Biedl syndrome 4 protein n=1 Tax=Fasciola hepatica TaxID=6192 RepID=A0A4E0RH49_FASHE|nr:Bardet-Biedl syndrome 4 protein [Fasciola hepatica]